MNKKKGLHVFFEMLGCSLQSLNFIYYPQVFIPLFAFGFGKTNFIFNVMNIYLASSILILSFPFFGLVY